MAGNIPEKTLAATMGKELPMTYSTGKYLFGIWRNDITRNLLWHVESGKGDSSNESEPRESRRQAGRYAPTWSWASVTGRTSYIEEVNKEHRSETRLESKLDLLNSTIILHTKNAYGSGYGELTVGGRFLHLVFSRKGLQHKFDVFDARALVDGQKSIALAFPDVATSQEREIIPGKENLLLLVAEIRSLCRSNVKDIGTRPIGLLLERCPDQSK
jgi:hypothetical protein